MRLLILLSLSISFLHYLIFFAVSFLSPSISVLIVYDHETLDASTAVISLSFKVSKESSGAALPVAWHLPFSCLRLLTVLVAFAKMVLLPAGILVLLYTFRSTNFVSAQASSSETYSLSDEITNIIPPCARTCFTSFIQSNYPSSACTTAPTLDCLCSHSSTSGYTVGEGAVQCIISEDNAKFCQGSSATADVAKNAYNMCVGKANALPNTHATITATLVIETQSPSPSTLPSVVVAATTPSDTSVSNSIISASLSSSTAESGIPTSPPSVSNQAGITNTPTVIAVSQTAQASNSTIPVGLTTPQITGIAVGGGVAAILAVGGLILWACLRRKKILRNDRDSDFGFEVQHGNSMEHMFRGGADKQFGNIGPGGTANGVAAKLPPKIPPRLDTDQNMFSRRSIPALEIGVAISPDRNQVADGPWGQRHASKLLPEKPTLPKLAVVIPEQPSSRPWHPPIAQDRSAGVRQGGGRDSVATQFEEDVLSPEDASARTGGNLDIGFAYTPQQVVLPQPTTWQMTEPPRSMTVPPQAVVKPLEIRKSQSHQSFSKPLRPRTGGSSVYSETDFNATHPNSIIHDQSWRSDQNYLQTQNNPYETYQPYQPRKPKQSDSGSITSIESAAQVEPRNVDPHIADLSPVVESPVGRSPVSYPRIPQRLSDRGLLPLKQPNYEPVAAERWARTFSESTTSTNTKRSVRNTRPEQLPLPNHIESTSSSPSLLAKRRGNKAAPSLNLSSQGAAGRGKPTWRVVTQIGNEEREDLPPTPGWTPKLTPKKIGDEMYFDVK